MSAAALTEPCGNCKATGRVPREVRILEDGKPDPLDFRREELCPKCGGTGRVPLDKAAIAEPKPSGFIADSI